MLATLIPLFDDEMTVCAYSIFAQKENFLLNPSLAGRAKFDGATNILGMDILNNVGIDILTGGREVFVEVSNVSLFSDIENLCNVPHDKLVLLMDYHVEPEKMYLDRLHALKNMGYRLAIRKVTVEKFDAYKDVLRLMDYILLDHKKVNMKTAKFFFDKFFPDKKLIAVNVESSDDYETLKEQGGYDLYEGPFFRMPRKEPGEELAPLKVNYINLLNVVNDPDFKLEDAAAVIGRDTSLVIDLLAMVNHMTVNSEITSVQHAAAMLGQKELRKWINTVVAKELCSDKPSEIMRVSMLRAKFAENLAPIFEQASQSSELFLTGLFSVLDIILERPLADALNMVKVSKGIQDALLNGRGNLAMVLNFLKEYENASWQEVSRLMLLGNIDMDKVYNAYVDSLMWYKELLSAKTAR